MQSVQYDQSDLNELQTSLDAYLDRRLAFADLRTQWIIALSERPDMRSNAVRLLYQQPAGRKLSDEQALSMKRIVETSIHGGAEDWTVVLEEDCNTESFAAEIREARTAKQSVIETTVSSRSGNRLLGTRERTARPAKSQPKARLPDPLPSGHVLGNRFVLEELLGRGGIGLVYRAHDRLRERTGSGSAKIAVKVLRGDFRHNPEMLSALQREALQAQVLSHPNIVRIHDFHQDGEISFLTMELLEGELLRTMFSRLQPGTVSQELSMRIIARMCRGLAHAHANGLVHADFKPGNVFLTSNDELRIFDFGLAQTTSPKAPKTADVGASTRKSLRAITPAYSSCNRLEGGPPGFSDDVYSLSCVIYELLAGHHPYDKKSAMTARELNMQPVRIKGLTNLQWRTLSAGLRPSQQDRATEVYDLQDAFTRREPVHEFKPRPTVVIEKRRSGALVAAIAGLLLGAGLVSGMSLLGIKIIPSKYVDLARESALAQQLQPDAKARDVEPIVKQETVKEEIGPLAMPPAILPAPAEEIVDTNEPSQNDAPVDVGETTQTSLQAGTTLAVPDSDSAIEPYEVPGLVTNAPLLITPGFKFDSADYTVQENATVLAVKINRVGDTSGPAEVEWTTFSDSAESQVDYAGFFRRVVQFAAGEDTKTIFIPIVADNTYESNEIFQIALSRPGGDMVLAQPFTATVTIIDDDF